MSATAEDLRTYMYENQISPKVLHLLFEGDDVGSKSEYVKGEKVRTGALSMYLMRYDAHTRCRDLVQSSLPG